MKCPKFFSPVQIFAIGGITVGVLACGKDGKPFGGPLIKPPVDEATPAALKPGASLSLMAPISGVELYKMTVPERLKHALTKEQSNINGGANCYGVIGCSLEALDYRINEINRRTEESEASCTSGAASDFKYEALGQSITLKAQCHDIFADNGVHGTGSGLIFGKDGDIFSVGMALDQGSQGRFQYQANYDQAANVVTYLEHSYWTDSSSESKRVTATHLKANRSTKAFELSYGSYGDDIGLGCGAQIKSNGTHIFIKAVHRTSFNQDCAEAAPYEACLDAVSYASVEGSCGVSAADFELGAPQYPSDPAASIAELKNVMGSSHFGSYGAPFKPE